MKDILEKFEIELSQSTTRKMNQEMEMEWEGFSENGDYEKSFDEMDKKEVFEYAFLWGYKNAMLDTLLYDAGDDE